MDYKELFEELNSTDSNFDRILNSDKDLPFTKSIQKVYAMAEKYVHLIYLIEQNKIKIVDDRLIKTSTGEETNLIDIDSIILDIE